MALGDEEDRCEFKVIVYKYLPFVKECLIDERDILHKVLLNELQAVILARSFRGKSDATRILSILKKIDDHKAYSSKMNQNLNIQRLNLFISALEVELAKSRYQEKISKANLIDPRVATPKSAEVIKKMKFTKAEAVESKAVKVAMKKSDVVTIIPPLLMKIKKEEGIVEFPANFDFIISKDNIKLKKVCNIGYSVAEVDNNKVVLFRCFLPGCPFLMKREDSFVEHIKIKHSNLTWNHSCAICDEVLNSQGPDSVLDEWNHMKEAHILPDSTVPSKETFSTCDMQEIVKHSKIEENKLKVLGNIERCIKGTPCPVCKEVFVLFDVFFQHIDQEHGDWKWFEIKCYLCNQTVEPKNTMGHMESCHKVGMYQCLHCIFACNSIANVKDHYKKKHESLLPFYCIRMGSDFADPKSIRSVSFNYLK